MKRICITVLLGLAMLLGIAGIWFGSAMDSFGSAISGSLAELRQEITDIPTATRNLLTMDPEQIKVTRKKHDEKGLVILEATFCWDGTEDDLRRIAAAWQMLCDAL